MLHQHLRERLPAAVLGDDPKQPGYPVYIVGSSGSHAGLDRLQGPLSQGGAPVAHIALVYSELEETGFDLRSALAALGQTLRHLFRYVGLLGLVAMGIRDLVAMLKRRVPAKDATWLSLRVRREKLRVGATGRVVPLRWRAGRDPASGLLVVLKQLADDVCGYVRRARMRGQIQEFVTGAILRLANRPDVAAIVINSHSQGTVVAFEVLHALPPAAAQKIRWFITAGSPLRKYVDFFSWTRDIGALRAPWTNFWDPRDPVADPLAPAAAWRAGSDSSTRAGEAGLYAAEAGERRVTLVDWKVDNVNNSPPGAVGAHNYWDNREDFVKPVAQIVERLARTPSATQVVIGRAGGLVAPEG